jgi:glycosyltransferase involved in cell wall biosynthesis
MPKTILVITDNVPDQINGVVTTFKALEDHAGRNGYRIVYCDPRQFPNISCPGYPEVRLCWPHGISKKIKAIHPDFIHIATEGPVGFFARWWCERNRIPYNTSYHTKFPEFLNKLYGIPVAWTYWYMRWFHRHSERVLVTTESMRVDLESRGFKNLVVWSRGVDRTIQPTVDRSGYRPIPRLLSVGRVSKEKGLDDLIQFQDDYDLVIVGDGPYRAELERKLPGAKFFGYLHGQDLVNQYALADVFVFPSVTDTFGVVIIEALAQGCPVAAYPVAGPVDIIKNGVTGYLDNNLAQSVRNCLALNNDRVKQASQKWTWAECWRIFKKNLVSVV